MPDSQGRLLVKEAAELLGVHPNTVANMMDRGELRYERLPGAAGTRRVIAESVREVQAARRLIPMQPMIALLRADMRAAEIRHEAMHGDPDEWYPKTIVKGAATHCYAHLLAALDELGWELRRKKDR